jgi:hypothetical protein
MLRVVSFSSFAKHRNILAPGYSHSAAASGLPLVHPSAGLVLVILIAVGCLLLVARMVNFVLVNLVAQLVQLAAAVFFRVLALIMLIVILAALVLAHL